MTLKFPLIAFLFFLLYATGRTQDIVTENQVSNTVSIANNNAVQKGDFFITPFYEFTRFQKLKLISNTNYYHYWDQESSEELSEDIINRYNDFYGTEYINSLVGIKMGYEVLKLSLIHI